MEVPESVSLCLEVLWIYSGENCPKKTSLHARPQSTMDMSGCCLRAECLQLVTQT